MVALFVFLHSESFDTQICQTHEKRTDIGAHSILLTYFMQDIRYIVKQQHIRTRAYFKNKQ